MSKLTNQINVAFLIPYKKLATLAVFLLNWMEMSSCYNIFSKPIPFIDWVKVLKLTNNPWNLVLLYYGLVNKLKIYETRIINDFILSINLILYLNKL